MGGYNYTVFGAGRQGTAAVHDLVLNCEAERVLVVEPDATRRKGAEARLSKLLMQGARKVTYAGAAHAKDLADTHCVLSCASYQANVALTKMAIDARIPFCDLGGNPQTVAAQEKLAAKRSVPVVPDCGVSPGLSNILAVHCARTHGSDTIRVRCGGLPLVRPDARANPLQYKLVFSPWGLISEYSGAVPVIRNGKVASVPALSVIEEFDADHEASPTSNNSPQVVQFLARSGVRDYGYMTVRYKGHFDQVRGWHSLGYLRGDVERDRELAAWLETDPVLKYDAKKDRDKLILRVTGSRSEHAFKRGFEYRIDVAADTRTKFTAMELTTSWGITIVAHHIASRRGAPQGFSTPERFVDTAWVIAELEKRLAAVRT